MSAEDAHHAPLEHLDCQVTREIEVLEVPRETKDLLDHQGAMGPWEILDQMETWAIPDQLEALEREDHLENQQRRSQREHLELGEKWDHQDLLEMKGYPEREEMT